jgi:hypothetical protein
MTGEDSFGGVGLGARGFMGLFLLEVPLTNQPSISKTKTMLNINNEIKYKLKFKL